MPDVDTDVGGMLDDIIGFLFGDAAEEGAEEVIAESVAPQIGNEGFQIALELCGNEGQTTIIEGIGSDGFVEAAEAAGEGDDAFGVLEGYAAHPEAVFEILGEAGEYINEAMADITD